MDELDGFAIRATQRPVIRIAFQKIDPRNGWQTLQLIHRISQRTVHHAMDQETMLLRIDIRNALHVVHQEMEAGWSDDSIQILKRSCQRRICGHSGLSKRPSYCVVERGGLSVGEAIFEKTFACRCLAAHGSDRSHHKADQGATL